MKIGTVSERLGLRASTIRYYEKIGLLKPQARVSGRRDFDDQALLTLQFVQIARAAGFSIEEIKALLSAYAADPSQPGKWRPFAEAKRASVRRQINDLKSMDDILMKLIKCECSTLSECVNASRNPTDKSKMSDV